MALGSMVSLAPTLLIASCASAFTGNKPSAEQPVPKEEQTWPPYKPFYQVPEELFEGVKLDPKRYDELKREQMEVTSKHTQYSLVINDKKGYFTFEISNEILKEYFNNSDQEAEEYVRDSIKWMTISPIINKLKSLGKKHLFSVSGKVGRSTTPWVNGLFAAHSLINYFNKMGGREYIPGHELNHTMFWNEIHMTNDVPISRVMNFLIDNEINILESYPFVGYNQNKVQVNPWEWMPIKNDDDFSFCNQYLTKTQYPSSILTGDFWLEFSDYIRQNYIGIFPMEYNKENSHLDEIWGLRFWFPHYNFHSVSPLQAFNIMKSWAKNTLNMANGNIVHVSYDDSLKAISNVDFSSFGMPETNRIQRLEIIDSSTNKVIYNAQIAHEDYPFGFTANQFEKNEPYKYVVPAAFSFKKLDAKLLNEPNNLIAKLYDANNNEIPADLFLSGSDFTKKFDFSNNRWEDQDEQEGDYTTINESSVKNQAVAWLKTNTGFV